MENSVVTHLGLDLQFPERAEPIINQDVVQIAVGASSQSISECFLVLRIKGDEEMVSQFPSGLLCSELHKSLPK